MITLELTHRAEISGDIAPRKMSQLCQALRVVCYISWSDGIIYSYDVIGDKAAIELIVKTLDYSPVQIKEA